MNPRHLFSSWLNQSLGHRLTLASVTTAVVLVAFLGLSAIPLFFHQAWRNFSGQSQNEIQRLADHITLRLNVIEQNLAQLAENSFVVNSLVDSSGRELYLQPTLRDFSLPFDMESRQVVLDANLELIGSSVVDAAALTEMSMPLAARALESEKPSMAVRQSGPEVLVIVATPIFYPAATAYEGVLVSVLKASDVFYPDADASDDGGCAAITAGAVSLLRAGCTEGMVPEPVGYDVFAKSALAKDVGLKFSYSKDRAPLHRHAAMVLVAFLLMATAAVAGVYIVSRRVGRDLSQRLEWLSKTAQDLAANPSAPMRVVWNRPDEIGRFTRAFNTMVQAWQELQASLERRVAERTKELAASERNYASLSQAAPVGIFRIDLCGRCVYVNELWCEMAGVPEDEVLGKEWLKAIHRDDRGTVAQEWARAVAERRAFSLEHRLTRASGTTLWVIGRVVPIEDEDGSLLGYVGTVTDISERKRAEETLRQAEERYRSVVENIKEIVFQTDADGRWSFLNRAWEEVTGYSIAESLGQSLLMFVHPDERENCTALFASLIERKTGYCRHEVRYLCKDGGFRWIEVFACLTRDAQDRILGTSGTLTDITERRAAGEQLERIAHYDGLTQLPNRILLADRMTLALAHAKRTDTLVAVCYLDLDGFKAVNDAYGHAAGDRLLVEVARRLTHTLRAEDTVARLGGDEFVALLPGLKSVAQCEEVLQRTIRALSEPVHLDNAVATVSASFGVSFYPETADDGEALLRQADHAMYEAKQAGKNRYKLFNSEQDHRVRSRRARLDELERAMTRGELVLYYQPKVSLQSGSVCGAEALLRWNHPDQGLLLPGAFLMDLGDAAVEANIDRWVLEAGLRQIEGWRRLGFSLPVSINVSAAFLESPDFVAHLRGALAAHPAARGLLELEVLELTALEDVDHVAQIISECRGMDVSFALDDFGTGYSSLTYFRRLPAQTLKIDISFVRDMLDDPDDMAIVKGVIGLTKAFGRTAVAEGVATVAHAEALRKLGCDLGQGFGIARPMPAAEVPRWLHEWSERPLWGRADLPEPVSALSDVVP